MMSSWIIMCQLFIFLLLLYYSAYVSSSSSNDNSSNLKCNEVERKALLQFKKGLKDPSNQLSSWRREDCCTWKGVGCNIHTGNVVKLDLRSKDDCSLIQESVEEVASAFGLSCLSGEISSSLLKLKHLNYLDLSMNNFQGILIPEFMGSFKELRYLNLSHSAFSGIVPPNLGNLSNLQYLDLSSYIQPDFFYRFRVANLNWLSGLHSLRYLNLGSTSLGKATGWLHAVNKLPFLKQLHLYNCELPNLPTSLPNLNFTSLSVIDLSYNDFKSLSMPTWLFNISTLVDIDLSFNNLNGTTDVVKWGECCNLRFLDLSVNGFRGDTGQLLEGLAGCRNATLEELNLSSNEFTGKLPDSLDKFKYLRSLKANENSISGPVPSSIGSLSFLQALDLSYNNMNGSIPNSVGGLAKLTILHLYQNHWKGNISKTLLDGLTELKEFSISSLDATFVLHLRNEWIPPFSLTSIQLSNCPLGPKFPAWLKTQTELSTIVLKNVSISQTIPDWLWELSPQIETLDLSHNQIDGVLPTSMDFSYVVDLSFNLLKGSIPIWPKVIFLYLNNNAFSGSIPPNIGHMMSSLLVLDLSANSLNGSIPSSIGKLRKLISLDLSTNNLTGKIPNNWEDLPNLLSIDLSMNKLSGTLPASLCSPFLDWLKLSRNNLFGDLSLSLQNCTNLSILDLGYNRFFGNIPECIGTSMPLLSDLRLHSNTFSRNIPEQLCNLSKLHILDLSQNNLSGSIPRCLGNLSGFSSLKSYRSLPPALRFSYIPDMDLSMKGRQLRYAETLELVNIIDLSGNNLEGEIPKEMINLLTLGALNLSSNHLTGQIPEKIGNLQKLESLDLSSNNLSGPIPLSTSSITSLSHLNVSYNNLSGPIPFTNQFLTFDPSIYEGNPKLCGPPLPTKCDKPNNGDGEESDKKDEDEDEDEDDDKYDKLWLYLSIGLGFFLGFWTVCGSLVIKKTWRDAYYGFLDKLKDWLIVVVLVNVARLQRRFNK